MRRFYTIFLLWMVYDLPRITNVTQLELILELLLSSDSMQSSSSLSFNSAKSAFEKIETFLCKSSFFLIKHLGFWKQDKESDRSNPRMNIRVTLEIILIIKISTSFCYINTAAVWELKQLIAFRKNVLIWSATGNLMDDCMALFADWGSTRTARQCWNFRRCLSKNLESRF